MILKQISISLGDGELHGDLHYAGHSSCPILLIIHGFRGSKNWGFFPTIAEEFAQNGSIVLTWNMSLNGYSDNAQYIDQPENFARNTITQEVVDTQSIIDSILQDDRIISGDIRSHWNGDIHVLGHSRGGGIGILISAKNPSIKKLALWNTISRFGRFTERQKKLWSETGTFPIDETEDGKVIAMNYTYISDLEFHSDEYSPLRAITEVSADILIVHAEQDMTVPIREAYALQEKSHSAHMHSIPQAGHIFGCTHPFTEMTSSLRDAIDTTTAFFST